MLALYCVILAFSLLLSTVLTWAIRNIATRYGWASQSIFSHHIHSRPIPRVGGMAVFLSFFGLLTAYAGFSRIFGGTPLDGDVVKLIIPGVCLFVTGLLDDLLGLNAKAKLFGQIVGGICLYAGGLQLFGASLQKFHPWLAAGLSLAATVVLVVLITNAINLIDGLDGLAAGVAIFSLISILIFALSAGAVSIGVASLILAGAIGGFLIFNFSPASIFLGDSGSLFVGMMLSGLVIGLSRRQESVLHSLMMPLFFFALPLADTAISVLRRLLTRRPLFKADRGHVHHMLLNLGLSHRAAVCVLYGLSAMGTVLSLVLLSPSPWLLASGAAMLLLVVLICVRKLRYREFAGLGMVWRRVDADPAVVAANTGVFWVRTEPITLEPDERSALLHSRSDLERQVDEITPAIIPDVTVEEATS